MVELPDVNVLVALLDGLHVHHRIAQQWFERGSETGWATCPLTISGVVRVISRPQPVGALSVSDARDLLTALIRANSGTHTFYPDPVDLLDAARFDLTKLQGYRQVTDLHLLGIAERHHSALVTLDSGLINTLKALREPSLKLLKLLPTESTA